MWSYTCSPSWCLIWQIDYNANNFDPIAFWHMIFLKHWLCRFKYYMILSLRPHHFVVALIYKKIPFGFPLFVDSRWTGRRSTPFHHQNASTWFFYPIPVQLNSSGLGNKRRLFYSSPSERSGCVWRSHRYRVRQHGVGPLSVKGSAQGNCGQRKRVVVVWRSHLGCVAY